MRHRTRPAAMLEAEGVSLCAEGLTREPECPGRLAELMAETGLCGASSRLAAVTEGVRDGKAYREHLADLAVRRVPVGEAVRGLLNRDARAACDSLLALHRESGGRNGWVFVPLDPYAGGRRAVAEAAATRWAVDRPNLVLGTHLAAGGAGLIGDLLARGIGVDVRSVFSPEQFDAVFAMYLTGLERARDDGHDLSGIHCAVSFPLRVLDETVAARIGAAAGRRDWAVAVARLAHHRREELMAGARWRALTRAGARPLHFVWSSYGAPVPEGVRYIEELVAWNSVSSAGLDVLRALGSRAALRGDTVSGMEAASRDVLAALGRAGVDIRALGAELQETQLAAARAEWTELHRTVEAALKYV
ncbi:transaldolase family protein [Streptomyces eurocidicus]|uniref:Transaldolase n=3 Tax=Streptomyces TaxID=1883 RepID=A0A7W8B926_STREU|nr:transaldolase family protein [Streptomyces eurocidicus]MBB5119047.1 transaldolase [Streptomyces eurocidicus]MBF6050499.1 hypothetical protein [Streptomyces eurocidicus]BBM96652.1 transaldolase [Streptomyces kitasatoensis]